MSNNILKQLERDYDAIVSLNNWEDNTTSRLIADDYTKANMLIQQRCMECNNNLASVDCQYH